MPHQGFFSLQSAPDLLAKARSDLAELRSCPTDPYLAFNFFVTARHIPDWLFPGDDHAQKALFNRHVELRVCRHLADGAKHFQLTAPHHTQVLSTTERQGPFDPAMFDPAAFDTGSLIVQLSPQDAIDIGLDASVAVLSLADLVMRRLELLV